MRTLSLVRTAVASGLLLATLAACGSTSSESPSSASTPAATDAATSAAASASPAATGYPSEDYWVGFEELPRSEDGGGPADTSKFTKHAADEPLVIGYADASQSNSFRVMAKAETEYAIANVDGGGATLVYTNADDSAPTQLSDVDDLITQGVDAIILAAVDVNGVCPAIKKATDAGIPVIVQERAVNCPDYAVFTSEDAVTVAENQMEFIAKRLGGKGKVAIISGVPGVGHSVESEQGYNNVLKNYPDIELTNTEYGYYDPTKAQEIAATILTAHPDLDAFASIDGTMTTGIVKAAEAAGKLDQLKAWTGNDVNGWMTTAVEKDLPNLTVPYSPKVGATSVDAAVRLLRGEPVNKTEFVKPVASSVDFSRNLAQYVNPDRPAEWWYSEMPCDADPFCNG